MYMCISGGKKCTFFGKFWVRTKWMMQKRNGFIDLTHLVNFGSKFWKKTCRTFAWFPIDFGGIVKHEENKQTTKTKKMV